MVMMILVIGDFEWSIGESELAQIVLEWEWQSYLIELLHI